MADVTEGDTRSYERTFTKEDVARFADVSNGGATTPRPTARAACSSTAC